MLGAPTIRLAETAPQRVGLLAGWGRFPVLFAETARQQGLAVSGLGIEGMYSDELPKLCDHFETFPLARLGRAIRYFRRQQVDGIVMAGKVDKRVLFHPLRVLKLWPDWRALHMWFSYARKNKADDTLLLAVIREFERDGLQFASALDFCPELLVKHGFLTRKQPSASQWKDIHFGWEIAKQMGGLDIGQTIVVNDTAVIAVEAIEGTDECIRRAGLLCRRGDLTVVKVAKPQQDRRFDVPTIGMQTIETMSEAGARCLAVEAGQTILLDEPEVVALANKLGIAIVSLHAEEVRLRIAS
jgi:DUF1009 family protein